MEFLKNFSNRRIVTTKSELAKVAKEVWSEIDIRKIRRLIKAWPFWMDLMAEELSFQTEHFSQERHYSDNPQVNY